MARSMSIATSQVAGLRSDTNILEVVIPTQMRKRIGSGVDWVDWCLGDEGGFMPSTVGMVTGGSGFGKTTFILHLADSLTKLGNIVLYNTGEESLYQTRLVTERLDLKAGFFCSQHTMMKDVLNQIDELRQKFPGKQPFLFQDSIQAADDGFYANGTNGQTPVRCAEMLTTWAKSSMGVALFIGQVNKDGDFCGKNSIKHVVDLHLHMKFDKDKKSDTFGERLFECRKNRFGRAGVTVIVGLDKTGLYEKGRMDFTSSI